METLQICISVVSVLVVIFGFALAMRYMTYRETIALAERGLVRPEPTRNGAKNKSTLRWGIVVSAIGFALCLGLWPLGLAGDGRSSYPLGSGPWMLFGLIPLFFGLALILIHIFTQDRDTPEPPSGE